MQSINASRFSEATWHHQSVYRQFGVVVAKVLHRHDLMPARR
jgi:hypothetical protein